MLNNSIIQSQRVKQLLLLAVVTAGAMTSIAAAPAPESGNLEAQTRPSEERKLAFGTPGIVKSVAIKEGDKVTVGQILAEQDDRQDQAAYRSLKAEAESTLKIDYSMNDSAIKEVQLKRKEKMLSDKVATMAEVEEARLAVDLAHTQIKLSQLEHLQKGYDAQKQEARLDQMKIKSPIDGIVAKLNIGEGEMADPQNRESTIVVVKNDPLWVESKTTPTAVAQTLKVGQTLPVRYGSETEWQSAKVIFISPYADSRSDSQVVRLEMPNPTGKAAGLQMVIKLPEKNAVADGK